MAGCLRACPELVEGSRAFRDLGFHGRIKPWPSFRQAKGGAFDLANRSRCATTVIPSGKNP